MATKSRRVRRTAAQRKARAKRDALATVMLRVPREFAEYVRERSEAMTSQTGVRHTGADVCRLILARMQTGG